MKKPLIVIFLGRPGSGKGTQAKLLGKKFGLDYIGSGDLVRSRKLKGDFTGKTIAKIMDKGGLIPTPIIFKLWLDNLEDLKKKKNLKGFVVDGSPRKILEAYLIDEVLEWYGWQKDVKIVLIDISKKEAFHRLTKRRQCKKCGRLIPWVGDFKKLKKCDKCSGSLVIRIDDDIQAIKKRFQEFEKETKPVINYYKKQKKLIKINGEQGIEDVFEDILKVIK